MRDIARCLAKQRRSPLPVRHPCQRVFLSQAGGDDGRQGGLARDLPAEQGDEPAEESPSPETGSAGSGTAGDSAGAGDTAGDSSAPAKGSADSPVVRSITEEAKPDEIPSEPDGFGISIEDTNR